jgi:thioredoxin reductase (NADPH)
MKLGAKAVALSSAGDAHHVTFDDGEIVAARSLVIATGASYNRLPLDRLSDFEEVGVYYAATQMEAQACGEGPVVIVGGGNSAGQAAVFLSRTCAEVHLIIRGASLTTSMSRYLIDQIERSPRIRIRTHTQVINLLGDNGLQGVELVDDRTGGTSTQTARGLFVFIGATPCTQWLDAQLATDEDGFLLTGADVPLSRRDPGETEPLFLETSRAGIFCVGDVRSGSVKRVASAIGEGATAVRLVFERLQSSGVAVVQAVPTVQ